MLRIDGKKARVDTGRLAGCPYNDSRKTGW